MFSTLNLSYKNLKETTPKKMLLNHYSRMENMKKDNELSLKKSLEISKNADPDKIENISKIMAETPENITNNNVDAVNFKIEQLNIEDNKIEIKLYDAKNTYKLIENVQDYTLNGNAENYIIPYNVDRIRKKGITTINNVYQSKYNFGNTNATGLGDFIRGCYFMIEFCEENNFKYKIIFNNIISNFLKIKTYNLVKYTKILNSITFFQKNNILQSKIYNDYILEPIKNNNSIASEFVEYMDKSTYYNGNLFICNNSYPRYDIQEKHKEYMKTILEPTDEMKEIITKRMNELYISYKKYIVIHVRCGDSYLKKESSEFKTKYISKLINILKDDIDKINNGNNVYLLISDNNEIKYILKKVFHNFKVFVNKITHLGEGIELGEENVKNTLTDFYLFSLSKKICSYSVYPHGSGFSYWCAKTYNIPYFCKYIK